MNNQKGFSPIVIILIIVALLAGGILAWQYLGTSEEEGKEAIAEKTSNWQIYQNERYQYEIKYPPDLDMVKEEFERQGVSVETVPMISWTFPAGDTPNIFKSVAVEVKDNPQKKSLLSVLGYDSAFCEIENEQDTFAKISCEMENGALQMIGSAYSKNDRVYIISLMIRGSEDLTGMDFSSEISTYNLILSTFKFLEEDVTMPSQKSAKDGKVMADMSMIGAAARIYYNKNGNYLNLSSDQDVFNLRKQIQNEIGRWPGMITSNDAYCADVTLSDGKTKYCIDSEGRRGENLGCSSTQLKCISY
jgi:hypothetical protein